MVVGLGSEAVILLNSYVCSCYVEQVVSNKTYL